MLKEAKPTALFNAYWKIEAFGRSQEKFAKKHYENAFNKFSLPWYTDKQF